MRREINEDLLTQIISLKIMQNLIYVENHFQIQLIVKFRIPDFSKSLV